ncbi:carbohydrate ABC transporter permease [Halomarina halobia]|uniref:Carbohydrate ABC transporter permease n=1 Tax=Halomarina halobia TaxID=3033386 RepID=A0ABD6A412_9EURY|nr:carbohydrate ABC transporter permease [Halomarina sp. PSR21]
MSTDADTTGVFGLDYRTADRLYRIGLGISATLFFALILFPIYWMFQSSLKTESALRATTWVPSAESFTLSNYDVLFSSDVGLYLLNSAVVTIGTVIAVVVISLIAGYGLARVDFGHKENFARFLLFGYMFSPIVLGLPLYLIWQSIGLLNTRVGLILALTAISMPFSVWLMWKYIQTIPESMEESAWIAGASRWRTFRDVIVPQTRPAVIAAALFAFAIAWNDFTFARILLPENQATTFAPGILRLITQGYTFSWGDMMAASLLMTIPPLAFAYFLQSYLLKGFQIRSL